MKLRKIIQKYLLVPLIIVALLILSCSDKIVKQPESSPYNLALTAKISSPELVQYIDLFHLQVIAFDMERIDVVQPFDGQSLSFELDIPAGVRRTFILEALESYPETGIAEKVIYRGKVTVDITPKGLNNVIIPMKPVVPLIKLTPVQLLLNAGQPFNLGFEIFNVPNLRYISMVLDYNRSFFYPDSVIKGSSITALDTVISTVGGDYNIVQIEVFDRSRINPSIVDPTGYSDLASIYFTTFFSTEQIIADFKIISLSLILNTGDTVPSASVYIHDAVVTFRPLFDKVVNFPDATLEHVVRNAINDTTSNPILLSQVLHLTNLSMIDLYITDLTGLEELKNLEYLNLKYNAITDFTPLFNLSMLHYLYLDGNYLTSIQQLGQLTSLQVLSLNENQIVDISPLTTLTNIQSLYLSGNLISDISSLLNNPGIGSNTYIDLTNNPLNNDAVSIHIPELESRGVYVVY